MKLLSWNCQGLRNPLTAQDLHHMVKEKKPKVVFLMETMIKARRVKVLKNKLGMEGCFAIDSMGGVGV